MRVLQIFGSLEVGGAESRMMDVYRCIDKKTVKFDFLVVNNMEDGQYFEEEIKHLGGNIVKTPSPRICGVVRHCKNLTAIMKSGQYGVVHAHTSYYSGIPLLVAKISGIKVRIAHARNSGLKTNGIKAKTQFLIGKWLIKHTSTAKVAVSEKAGEFLFGSKNFQIIPNAIDIEKYLNVTTEDVLNLKKEYELKEETIIGHVGRFAAVKNHKYIIELFLEYLKINRNAKLILIGEGPLRKDIERMVEDYMLNEKIIFLGVRSDVHLWMQIFDILLFPSFNEGLPGAVPEAQAAGTACVISDSITREVDMGLNLVDFVSLEQTKQEWIVAIEKMLQKEKINANFIRQAFNKRKYSLEREIEILQKLYGV